MLFPFNKGQDKSDLSQIQCPTYPASPKHNLVGQSTEDLKEKLGGSMYWKGNWIQRLDLACRSSTYCVQELTSFDLAFSQLFTLLVYVWIL